MNNQEGRIYYGIGLDNRQLQADANHAMSVIRGIGDSAAAEGARIDNIYKKITNTIGAVFTTQKAIEFTRAVIEVRGEIQQLGIAFDTMLGSKEKSDRMMADVKKLALNTPFTLTEVATNTKQLIAMGIAAENALDTVKTLGDVAAGLSVPLWRIAVNYGQVSALGKLQLREIKDFAMAGIPIVDELGKMLGKTSDEIYKMAEAGEIGFKQVEQVFKNMSGAGGKFNNLMEKQNASITGQISKLKDEIQFAMNEIGKSSEGAIYSSIKGASSLVQHYQTIGESLALLISMYGTYKAAIIATEAVKQSLSTVRYADEAGQLTALLTAEQKARISKLGLIEGSLKHSAAIKAEVAASIQAAQATLAKAQAEVSAASRAVAAKRAEYIAAKQLDQQRLAEMMSIGATGTAKQVEVAQRRLAAAEANKEAAALAFQNATRDFSAKKMAVETAAKQVNIITTKASTAAQAASTTATGFLAAAKVKLTAITAKLNAAIMANPYALAAAAVLALGYGIYKLITYQNEAERAQSKLNDSIKESEKAIQSERYQVDLMFTRLKAAKKGTDEYAAARKAIIDQYGEFLKKLGDEKTALNDIAAAYALVTEEATKSARARAMQKITAEAGDIVSEKQSDIYDQVKSYLKKRLAGQKGGNGDIDLADEYLIKLKPVIMDGAEVTEEVEAIIKKFDKAQTYMSGGNPYSGFTYSSYNPIREMLVDLQRVKSASEKTVKEALLKFGEVPKGGGKGAAGAFDPMTASLQRLMEKLPEAQAALEELRKAENPDPKAIAEQERLIKNIKEQTIEREKSLRVIREVEAQIKNLKDEQKNYGKDDAEYKAIEARINSLSAKLPQKGARGGSDSKPRDYTDQLEREAQEKIRLYKDIEFSVRQAEIDANADGLEKMLEQNKLNFEKEMEQIRRQKEDKLESIQDWERTIWESQNPNWKKKGLKFAPKTTQLSDDEEQQFKKIEKGAAARFEKKNTKDYEEALNDYAQFAEKYLDKVKEFNDNLKNLEKQGASEAVVGNVKAMQADVLAGLDEEMGVKEQAFITFVEGMVGMGLEQLLEALERVKAALEAELASGGGNEAQVTQLRAQVKSLTKRINDLTAVKEDTKKVKAGDPAKKWKDTLAVMRDVKELTNDVADSFGELDDATKAVMEAAVNIATGVINMIIGINTLAVGSAAATTAAATTAAEAIKGVERASVILAIISAALQIVMAIAKLIKGLFSGDNQKEKEIQRLQNQVDALKVAYDKLGKAIDKAYSANAADLIKKQDENLRRQRMLIQQQIYIEQSKKRADKKKIKEYRDALKEIDEALSETQDRVIEAIIGRDVRSAIDEFADAYADAWAKGENKAKSIKEVVRKMVKSAVTELIKSRLSPEVTKFMEFLSTAMKDGVLTIAEQKTLDALESEIYNKLQGLDKNLDKYIKDNSDREASKRGIATASQESVDENNGRLTAIQGHTYSINESVKTLVSNTVAILTLLSGIDENTKGIARLEAIESDMRAVKNTINDIALKGITLKR